MAVRSITIDREVCIGSGMCVVFAPNTFSQDEEAKSVLIDPAGDSDDDINAAIEGCPTGALAFAAHDEGE